MTLRKSTIFHFVSGYIFFIPTATWFGGQKFGLMMLMVLLSIFILLRYVQSDKPYIDYKNFFVISLLFFPLLFSMVLNPRYLIIDDVVEILRVILYALIFIFSYLYGRNVKYSSFIFFAKVFLIVQILVVVLQRFEVELVLDLFRLVWDDEKNWAFRNTGTFTNPNVLSFFSIVALSIILSGQVKVIIKLYFLLLAFTIIFLAASRTGLLAAILIGGLAFLNLQRNIILNFLKFIFIVLFLLLIIIYLLISFSEENYYISQILNLASTFDLDSISAFAQRLNHWDFVLDKMSAYSWFFGLGPGKGIGLRFIDSEYLALIVKYGLFGFLMTSFVFTYIFISVQKVVGYDCYKKFFTLYLSLLLFSGLAVESFTTWYYILPFFMFYGVLRSQAGKVYES